jgi:hypothetical protein
MNAGADGEVLSRSGDNFILNAKRNVTMATNKADFRTFYRDAHAVECLTDRETMLIGLAVAMMRLCDP